VTVSCSDVVTAYGIQGIDFSINNNLKNIYTNAIGTEANNLLPTDIRIGMQEVTGNLSVYNIPGNTFISSGTEESIINVGAPGFNEQLHVVFKPQEISASLGPVITKVPFVGVDYALGE
jgi:hypothetical protein